MIKYPNELDIIFKKLLQNSIRPIIVGGFVRDFLLHKASKDIDIELYGISSYAKLEKLLEEFGDVNSVGKCFGICKLTLLDIELDFSFPRCDSKIALGHNGFQTIIDTSLDFKSASRRRDFTINAIGFDIEKKIFLDPYNGKNDLKLKLLNAVDEKTFVEDPLRVLRAVQMSRRFEMSLSNSLFLLCKHMVQNRALEELPKERILEEMKKLFFLASNISEGFILLEKFGAFYFFTPLDTLEKQEIQTIYKALDKFVQEKKENNKTNLTIMFATVCYYFSSSQISVFLAHFTNDKKLIKDVTLFVQHKNSLNISNVSDYDLYLLATKLKLREYFLFISLFSEPSELYKRAEKLQILDKQMPNLLEGKDLIHLGLKPSQLFSEILKKSYEAQMRGKLSTKEIAINSLKESSYFDDLLMQQNL